MKTLEERVEWLEKNHEKLYHENDVLIREVMRLFEWTQGHAKLDRDSTWTILTRIGNLRSAAHLNYLDLQRHFKVHTGKKNINDKYKNNIL